MTLHRLSEYKQWKLALGLGAVSGMRSLLAPALLSRTLARSSSHHGLLGSAGAARLLGALALLELIADKSSRIPARTKALPLLGRALSGALVGHAVATGAPTLPRCGTTLLGAGMATGASFVTEKLRRAFVQRYRVPDVAAGLIEDAIAISLAWGVLRSARGSLPR